MVRAIARLEELQAAYLAASDCIDPDAWRARSRLRRLPQNIARMMSPLL